MARACLRTPRSRAACSPSLRPDLHPGTPREGRGSILFFCTLYKGPDLSPGPFFLPGIPLGCAGSGEAACGSSPSVFTAKSTEQPGAALDALCEQLRKIHQQAEIRGLFIGDRELLDCAHCGLQEDVLIDGRLVTYQADAADATDSGLRFAAADDGNFVCPQWGR